MKTGFTTGGPITGIHCFFIYDYIVYAYFLIIKYRKKMDKRTIAAPLCFSLWRPPLQACCNPCFSVTLLTCPGLVVSIIILYINIQNKRMNTDYLTGVFNRREADGFIQNKINAGEGFSAIILDIDKFKEINDGLGHQVGDDALEAVAKILKGTLRSNDFIARYGGDEFLIVLNMGEKRLLELAVKRIHTAVKNYNPQSQ